MKHNNRQFPSHSDLVIERRYIGHRIGRPSSLKMARSLLVALSAFFFFALRKKILGPRASGEERSALPENSPGTNITSLPQAHRNGEENYLEFSPEFLFNGEFRRAEKMSSCFPLRGKMHDLRGFVCLWKAVNKGR